MNNTSLGEKFCINAVACTLATTVTVSLKGLILSIEPIFGLKSRIFLPKRRFDRYCKSRTRLSFVKNYN